MTLLLGWIVLILVIVVPPFAIIYMIRHVIRMNRLLKKWDRNAGDRE